MDASWLTKYPKAAAMLQQESEILEYAADGVGPELSLPPPGLFVPASYGRQFRHHGEILPSPYLDVIIDEVGDIPACTTLAPAALCACGMFRLHWEEASLRT